MRPFKRALAALLLAAYALAGCGGGSDSPETLLAPEVVLSGPYTIVPFEDTGKVPGSTSQELRFTVTFEDYFRCVPDGHVGVMLHADLSRIPTGQYRGVGWVAGRFGNSAWTTRKMPDLRPVAVVETWAVGDVGPEFDALLMPTLSPELQDWVPYEVTIRSYQAPQGNRIGYRMVGPEGLVVDTEVADSNPVVDLSQPALAFFNATGAGAEGCPYKVRFTRPTSTWR
jgi:hypothetical protein